MRQYGSSGAATSPELTAVELLRRSRAVQRLRPSRPIPVLSRVEISQCRRSLRVWASPATSAVSNTQAGGDAVQESGCVRAMVKTASGRE
jgi:hypothetical protein